MLATILVVVYSVVLGLFNNQTSTTFRSSSVFDNQQLHYSSAEFGRLCSHTFQSEYIFQGIGTQASFAKKNSAHFQFIQSQFNLSQAFAFWQYSIRITKAYITYRKSDILFPFHYFW